MINQEILLFLLKGGHIDMQVRIEKGIWPHPSLKLKECIIAIVNALNQDKCFPYPWINRKDGEFIDDVGALEKIDETKFIYRYREASPSNLREISVNKERVFITAQAAAEYYVRNILRLPGDLDGWKVIE
jgi:hypothetical protein